MRFLGSMLLLCACGGGAADAPDAGDAGGDVHYGHKAIDASVHDAAPDVSEKTPWDRMTSHSDVVLGSMRLHAFYVLGPGDLAESYDALMSWIISSPDYWSILAQYGVGYGTFDGSTTLETSTFFQPGDVNDDLVADATLSERLSQAIAELPPDDGGAPNAAIVFLPRSADVDLGDDGTCKGVLGYHTVGSIPYAVVRWCGSNGTVISHELAEMATDPVPFAGWYSEADEWPAGGEVGDLCNAGTNVDDNWVTELWSNADGECEPQ